MTIENSSGEVIRFAGERQKSAALEREAGQENSITFISRNNYPVAFIQETNHLEVLMKS